MKRKILHFYPDHGGRGGIERFLEALGVGLLKCERFHPVVVCSQGTPFYDALSRAGVPVHGVRTLGALARPWRRVLDLATAVQVAAILSREKPDLIHVHIGDVENLWFQVLGYPVTYTFHGYASLYTMRDVRTGFGRAVKKVRRWMFRLAASCLDRLIFVSRSEALRMFEEGYLPPGLSHEVLPPAIDVGALQRSPREADRAQVRASLGVPESARCVGFVNRLDANKNPLAFIQFAEQFSEVAGFEQTHFVIAGDGPLREQVSNAAAASRLGARLRVCGHRGDVAPLFRALDLALFTPRFEGFGLGMVEAMAVGTLCLAHDTGGLGEILEFPERELFLAAPDDPRQLLEKAVNLLTGNGQPEWRERLRKRALDFDLSALIPRLEEIYLDVLRGGNGDGRSRR